MDELAKIEGASTPAPPSEDGTVVTGRVRTVPILAVALGLRLLVLLTVVKNYPTGWLYTRGMEMGWLAESLLRGQGLSSPFGTPTGPTAFIAPVYPILIAGVFKVFGTYSTSSAVFILVAQILINLVTVYLITRVSVLLFDTRTANIAGFFWACSLPLIWIPTILWETSISICLVVGLIYLALKFREPQPWFAWAALGGYCGFAALVNPALMPSVLAVFAWTAVWRIKSNPISPIIGFLVLLAVFAPWPIRNARVFHAFIPTRTTVGFELWMGNHPGSSGFLDESLFPAFNQHELDDYKSMGEIAYTSHKTTLAKSYIQAHPTEFVGLTLRRFVRFWTGTGTQGGSIFFPIHAILTTGLGLIGLGLLFRRRDFPVALLFLLPVLFFPLPYYITHAEFRYRLLIDPFMTILAASAISLFLQESRKRRNDLTV